MTYPYKLAYSTDKVYTPNIETALNQPLITQGRQMFHGELAMAAYLGKPFARLDTDGTTWVRFNKQNAITPMRLHSLGTSMRAKLNAFLRGYGAIQHCTFSYSRTGGITYSVRSRRDQDWRHIKVPVDQWLPVAKGELSALLVLAMIEQQARPSWERAE